MEERIIDISEEAAGLFVKHQQLVIRAGDSEASVPLDEVGALVIANPAVHLTHAVLSGLCERGMPVIVCNSKKLPVGMLYPLTGHFAQTERMSAQLSAPLPRTKQLWKQVVKSKIANQARLLQCLTGSDHGVASLVKRVLSGDSSNIEAQASRTYWAKLGGPSFRRIPGGGDAANSRLNYGYAVLRSIVARATCAVGLHPSVGLHHHNRYDPYCLVNDLMEPLRPVIDEVVFRSGTDMTEDALAPESKAELIRAILETKVVVAGQKRTLFDASTIMATSLAKALGGENSRLALPRTEHGG